MKTSVTTKHTATAKTPSSWLKAAGLLRIKKVTVQKELTQSRKEWSLRVK